MKLRPTDIKFSQYIRLRDKYCQRCHSPVRFNDAGMPISHHASHFWGRARENTRFDQTNVTTHCHGCHAFLTANPEEHRAWKLQQIGLNEYNNLMVRANTRRKRDDKFDMLVIKDLLEELELRN